MTVGRYPPWAYLLAAIVPIAVVAALGSALPKGFVMPLALVAMVWAAAMATIHWKRLDEAARAAHRWAWYWGGTIGLAGAMIFAVLSMMFPDVTSFVSQIGEPLVNPKLPPEQSYLFLGVMLAGVAQGIGFLGAWVYWWAAKR